MGADRTYGSGVRFTNRDDQTISSLNDWRDLGKPAADRHWKPGRSAYELSAAWIERDAQERVLSLLAVGGLGDVELVEAITEKRTRFDDDPRGPRNHDLLVRARHANQALVIAVEGKADEPFDKPLWKWRAEALRRSPNSGAPRRLDNLTTLFFGTTIDTDSGWPAIACLGYQLLSALAGTLADARVDGAPRAVLLVQEFLTSETVDEKHAINARVLDDFVYRLARTNLDRADTVDGWITEPVTVRGDDKWLPPELSVQVAKLVTDLRPETRTAAQG